jgi:hypothetical protein
MEIKRVMGDNFPQDRERSRRGVHGGEYYSWVLIPTHISEFYYYCL